MEKIEKIVVEMAAKAKSASRRLASLPTAVKNRILLDTAEMLVKERGFI
ncbi:MAG: gamma-glutamyl-phosphate reductase, partial [Desulfobulbaceae bacterium]|nr:gamma-glutamyl-phosphate reductase [Desulfobulbaceae bacterium]